MVGVPGKSKGCTTCRKRKKGCDLQRPSCGQCLRSGNVCGGYRRDLTFIHHPAPAETPGPNPPGNDLPGLYFSISTANMRRSVVEKQCQDLFWDLYMPRGDCAVKDIMILRCGHPVNWTLAIQQMPAQDSALNLAFLALSAARVGRDNNDMRLVQESLKIYGKALRDLQSALWDPKRMYSDETLVACMLLGQYEMFEGTGRNSVGWISHSQGAARLVELRGVARHANLKSNILFCGSRVPIIIAAIVQRKSTFLSSPAWLTRPWSDEGVPKTWGDRLFDIMTSIPLILELYDLVDDKCISHEIERQRTKHLQKLVEQCCETNQALQNWFASTREDAKPQFLTTTRPSGDDNEYPFAYRYHFKNHLFAQALMMYWTSCLILHTIMTDVNTMLSPTGNLGRKPDGSHIGDHESNDGVDLDPKRTLFHEIDESAEKVAALQPYMDPRQHALNIAQSLSYFLQPDMGALGGSYVKFPMSLSFSFFRGALQPGCRFLWEASDGLELVTGGKSLNEDGVKIVTWFRGILKDMKHRGFPTWDFQAASEGHNNE